MTFKRTNRTNEKGIEEVNKITDPLDKKMHMIYRSQAKWLKDEAHRKGITISTLVREALQKYITL